MARRRVRVMQILLGPAVVALLLTSCCARLIPKSQPAESPGRALQPTATSSSQRSAPQPTQAKPTTSPVEPVTAPTTSLVEPATSQPTEIPEPAFVPTVLSSLEKTVTVGAEMVDCPGEGAGGGRCYLVKEEEESDWTVFPGDIEGFEYWPGAEYVMVIREDKIANPPPGGPDVIWTLLKGLYKSNVPVTPTAAP